MDYSLLMEMGEYITLHRPPQCFGDATVDLLPQNLLFVIGDGTADSLPQILLLVTEDGTAGTLYTPFNVPLFKISIPTQECY
jgi:hypothetical protein